MRLQLNSFLRVCLCVVFFSLFFFVAPTETNADHCGGRAPGHPGDSSAPCSAFITEDPLDPFGGPGDPVDPADPADPAGGNGSGNGAGQNQGATQPSMQQQILASRNETEYMLYNGAVSIGGFIAGLGGKLFDLSIKYVVLEMGCWFTTTGNCSFSNQGAVGGVVNELWTVIRDLFNILFIFSLIYIGIRMILFADDSSTQRTLGLLIMAALLINFSLYFTKLIVDVSNFAAVTIHHNATREIGPNLGFGIQAENDEAEGGSDTIINYRTSGSLAGAYMQTLKMSSWFAGEPNTSWSAIVVASIMVLIFSVILGFTLAYGALMLIGRFVALIIFMILSPVMFLGWVLPSWGGYSKQWWDRFLKYAFFAPAYIFLLYVGLYTLIQVGNGLGMSDSSLTYANGVAGNISEGGTDVFLIFLYFAIGIAFLIAATRVGESMSAAGSATIAGGVKAIKQRALGAGGYIAGSSVGRYANFRSKRLADQDAARGAADSDYVPSRRRRARRAMVDRVANTRFGARTSFKERVDGDKAAEKEHRASVAEHVRKQAVSDIKEKLKVASAAGATDDQKIAAEEALSGASRPQLLEIAKSDISTLQNHVGSMSSADVKAVMDSDDINDQAKQNFASARSKAVVASITSRGGGNFQQGLAKATGDELSEIGYRDSTGGGSGLDHSIMGNAAFIQEGQVNDLKKKWGADSKKFQDFKQNRNQAIKDLARTDMKALVKTRKNNQELAQLPSEVVNDVGFITAARDEGKMSADLLRKIAAENEGVDKRVFAMQLSNAYGGDDKLPPDVSKYLRSPQGADYAT